MNLNECVWVRLTSEGEKVFSAWIRAAVGKGDSVAVSAAYQSGDGYRFQFWEFAQIFGASLYCGGPQIVVDNEIEIVGL